VVIARELFPMMPWAPDSPGNEEGPDLTVEALGSQRALRAA
jgi:hypothetical protein